MAWNWNRHGPSPCQPKSAPLPPTILSCWPQSTYAAGQVILPAPERGERFFIIKEGHVAPRAPAGAAARRLGPGEFFGEGSLFLRDGVVVGGAVAAAAAERASGPEVGAEYVADSARVVVMSMARAEFERLLGPYEELWR